MSASDCETFNFIWSQWVSSLAQQIPELHDAFDEIDIKLHALSARRGLQEPMRLFVTYVGEHLTLLYNRNAKLFKELYRVSEGQCLPSDFIDYYHNMDATAQGYVWGTLETLTNLAASTNTEFKEIVRETKEKLALAA